MATIDVMSHTPALLAGLFQGVLEGQGDPDGTVGAIVSDSRQVQPGGVFIALLGEHEDGHRHLADAAVRGAALAIVDHSEGGAAPALLLRVPDTAAALREACTARLDELGCKVVGITGSVGKTTVKEMCAHVLEGDRRVAKTPGNLNTWTGIPLTVVAVERPVDVFVAELAMSAPGEIRDLAGFTHPHVAVILNVGLAHVGLLGSVEAIAAAKAELLESLPSDGVAVLNADDPRVVAMPNRLPAGGGFRTVWFGLTGGHAADFRARDIQSKGLEGSIFTLDGPRGSARVHLPIAGTHAVLNACAAAAVAGQFDVGLDEVADRLATFAAPLRRGRIVTARSGATIYDDSYNSSPTSVSAALAVLAGSGAHHRLAVLGDMLELGDEADRRHEEAGRLAATAATDLVAVGEYAVLMGRAAVSAGMDPARVTTVLDADVAMGSVATLVQRLAPDVAILVKGSRAIGLDRVVEGLMT